MEKIKKKILLVLIFLILLSLYILYNKIYEGYDNSLRKKYVIITTSLIKHMEDERKQEYILAINTLIERCENKNYTLIIVENNGERKTFLDDFNLPVYYTNNNSLNTTNKGVKEINDILDVINEYNIKDDDFVIKITGRYKINEVCPFFDVCDNVDTNGYDAIIKYGGFDDTTIYTYKTNDCITGLIGLRCKYIKTINNSIDNIQSIEVDWANSTLEIPDDKVCILPKLGITLTPFKLNTLNR